MRTRAQGLEESIFNKLASEYDAWFEEEGKFIFASEVEALRKVLPSLLKPWLEIGVGSGRFAQALGIELGVDPSYKLAQMAKGRGVKVVLGRGEQGLFDSKSFGAVFLIVTLCFLDAPVDVLLEANRTSMPGGKLVLGLVLKDSPWGQYYQQKKVEGHRFYKYATFYGFNEVARLLYQAGFSVESVVSTLFQKPNGVSRIETPREGYFPDAGFTVIVAGKRIPDSEVTKKDNH